MSRYELELDDDTRKALHRLSVADQRSAAGTIRYLIRKTAESRGLWTPQQPKAVVRPAKSSQ